MTFSRLIPRLTQTTAVLGRLAAARRTASGASSMARDQVGQRDAREERLVADRLEPVPAVPGSSTRNVARRRFGSSLTSVRLERERPAPGLDAVGQAGDEHLAAAPERVAEPGVRAHVGPARAASAPSITSSSDGVSTRPAIQSLLIRAGSIPQTLKLYGCMKCLVIPSPNVRRLHSRKFGGGARGRCRCRCRCRCRSARRRRARRGATASITPSRHSLMTAGGRP